MDGDGHRTAIPFHVVYGDSHRLTRAMEWPRSDCCAVREFPAALPPRL